MTDERKFYRVASDLRNAPVNDHLMHGYESKWVFYKALRSLVCKWQGRVGECIGERHGFLRLRFHDTPGGKPDEEWLPEYLLSPAAVPEYMSELSESSNSTEAELDRIFGFD